MKNRFYKFLLSGCFLCALAQGTFPCYAEEGAASASGKSVIQVESSSHNSGPVVKEVVGSRALSSKALISAAGISAALLTCVGAIAVLLKFFGTGSLRPTVRQSNLHVAGRVHLGGQVYASLLCVDKKEFLVVTGNRSNPGISVVSVGNGSVLSERQQVVSPESTSHETQMGRSQRVDHAA